MSAPDASRNAPEPRVSRGRALIALLRPDGGHWLALGALAALGAGLTVAAPLVVQRIVDRASSGASADQLTRLAVWFLVLAVAVQLVNVVIVWFATTTAWRTTNDLRLRLARHVLGMDHAFHRQHTPGELIQRVDGDVTSVSDFFGIVLPKAMGAAVMIVGIAGVLLVQDWRLGAGVVVYVGAATGLVLYSRHRAVDESAAEMGSYARLYGGIEERLTAGEDLRANGALTHVMWRFVEESSDAVRSSRKREQAFLGMWWSVQGAVSAGAAASVMIGAWLVDRSAISIGTAFLLLQYLFLIERPLEDLVQQLEKVQKANGAMVRVIALTGIRSSIVDHGSIFPAPGPLAVDIDAVTFAYDDDPAVLHDVTLHLGAGRSLGVIGRTGSGKTTVSRLVTRLVEAGEGVVRLGGVAIADIPVGHLRQRVAMVPQEVELFNGSIRDNVTLFDPQPSDDDVAAALGAVGLAHVASDGVHRLLGAAGMGLSAGEAQLLALARVWLRQPDVMVLDEATARVDPHTERLLEQAITKLMAGRTTIIIAHRLSTLQRVDEIAVFDHGRLLEHGDRRQLMGDASSRFATLLALALDDNDQDVST